MKQRDVRLDSLKTNAEEAPIPLGGHQGLLKRAVEGDEELEPRNDVALAERA
jgi:hypothetical protein